MATITRTRSKGRKSKTTGEAETPNPGKAITRRKATGKRKTTARRKAPGRSVSAPAVAGPAASITKAEFLAGAKRLHLKIESGGKGVVEFDLDPREFSSGSFGWFASEKLDFPVGSKRVRCQLSFNVAVIGSKNRR